MSDTRTWLIAKEMALVVNGGDWDEDYTDAQKQGWFLKAEWVERHVAAIKFAGADLLRAMAHENATLASFAAKSRDPFLAKDYLDASTATDAAVKALAEKIGFTQ